MYVGYLPLPAGHARFLRVVVPIVVVALVVGAGAIARQQRGPGAAVLEAGAAKTWEGTLLERPYPMLVEDGAGGGVHLLVKVGKRGAQERVAGRDGERVRATGWELRRDGRRIIELVPGAGGLASLSAPAGESSGHADVAPVPLGDVTLVGEIVDGKCFLGAMKPGDGKGHKSCAILCLRGGLPPMLATRDAGGAVTLRLLTIDGSTNLPQRVLNLVAEPVVVRGREVRIGGMTYVDAAEAGVVPVGPRVR
jgi:hypothetical protein